MVCFTQAGTQNLPRFQAARSDHVQGVSSCSFPMELVSFVHPDTLSVP